MRYKPIASFIVSFVSLLAFFFSYLSLFSFLLSSNLFPPPSFPPPEPPNARGGGGVPHAGFLKRRNTVNLQSKSTSDAWRSNATHLRWTLIENFQCFLLLGATCPKIAPRWPQDGPKMAHFLGRSPFRPFLGLSWNHVWVILGLSRTNRTSIFVRRHRIFGMLSSQSFVSLSFASRGPSSCQGPFLCDIIAL